MIQILDYGSGNVRAIQNIYKRLGIPSDVSSDPDGLRSATKIIVPGVGAFDETMLLLERSGMRQVLDELVLEKKVPVLGVCVGMQIMARSSEEGEREGLSWVPAEVRRFDANRLPSKPHLPHMGWNSVRAEKEHPILDGVDFNRGFYFLHSYYIACHESQHIMAVSDYGDTFACAIQSDNVFGFQFHPEKSHANGIAVLKNFAFL